MPNKFTLSPNFVEKYSKKKPPFGFNGLGELVYRRTYSRIKEDGNNEEWFETIERVINGTYNMQKEWIDEHQLGWNAYQAQKSAQKMYDKMFNMYFLPPGRGLWAMGSNLTEEKKLYASLNNCASVSTENIDQNFAEPFMFLMDMSMLGVGVGFDLRGTGKITIKGQNKNRNIETYTIPDTREGWVESLKLLLESYSYGSAQIEYDYSLIRKAGEPIKGFGGISSGYEPLKEMLDNIKKCLDKEIGQPISQRCIADIMNLIGKCVVFGNVRRTAEIMFGDPTNEEYLDFKNYEKNPDRESFGWTSNNSILATLGMNYNNIVSRITHNGEPGLFWLENAQKYSRMVAPIDNKDKRATLCNPCVEQTLESMELCCLVETFPHRHESLEEFLDTIKYAYLYAKTVTLGKTHWPQTNRVMLRNRRIGCSISGIAQFITNKGLNTLKDWMERGYNRIQELDEKYSDWFAIPRSIKTTSIKPSGSISLLAGATPGLHYPQSNYYIRRMTISKNSSLVDPLKKAGYVIEESINDPQNSFIVQVPVTVGEDIKTIKDVSIWEQLSLAAFCQKYWSDNQVSCTVTFNEDEKDQIESVLNYFQYQLKGISFLPNKPKKVYAQMPYEEITKDKFDKMNEGIKTIHFKKIKNELVDVERFCDGDSCQIIKKS